MKLDPSRTRMAALLRRSPGLKRGEADLLLRLIEAERPEQRRLVAVNLPYNARNRMITFLGTLGDEEPLACLEIIQELLIDDLLTVRTTAESILPALIRAFPQGVSLLEQLIRNEYPRARDAVAATLQDAAHTAPDPVGQVLVRWAGSSSRDLRETAARGLTALGPGIHTGSVEALLSLTRDEYSVVRAWSVLGLGPAVESQGGPVLTALIERVRDVRWSVRIRVAQALARVPEPALPRVLPILASLAMDVIPTVSRQAAAGLHALARTRPHACLETLRTLAGEGSLIDVDAVLTLIATLREVGMAEPEAARRILRSLIHNPDPGIRRRAHQALRSLRREAG